MTERRFVCRPGSCSRSFRRYRRRAGRRHAGTAGERHRRGRRRKDSNGRGRPPLPECKTTHVRSSRTPMPATGTRLTDQSLVPAGKSRSARRDSTHGSGLGLEVMERNGMNRSDSDKIRERALPYLERPPARRGWWRVCSCRHAADHARDRLAQEHPGPICSTMR